MTMVLYVFIVIISFAILLFTCGKKTSTKRRCLSIAFDSSIMVVAYYLKDTLPLLVAAFLLILGAYFVSLYFVIYKKENNPTDLKPVLTMAEKIKEYVSTVLCFIPLILKSEYWLLVLLLVYFMFEGILSLIQKYLHKVGGKNW